LVIIASKYARVGVRRSLVASLKGDKYFAAAFHEAAADF
jgi:hypothetical protein